MVATSRPSRYRQVGPRAHHFVALASFLVGLSFLLEDYSGNSAALAPFNLLGAIFHTDGQFLWAWLFLILSVSILLPWNIWIRFGSVVVAATLWGIYAFLTLAYGLTTPDVGSVVGLLSLCVVVCCIVAATNLVRDFNRS